MPTHTEFAREDGSTLTVEMVEDREEYPGVIIRVLTYGETGVDLKVFLTHRDVRALMPALAEAVERGERACGFLSGEGER